MATTPRGMAVTEAYRTYRDNKFVVNRAYQRKLVWTLEEKALLIDSVIKGFPIPLVLLLQRPDGRLEIIDGMQRLNAIVTFIECAFSLNGKFFDIREFTTARQFFEDSQLAIDPSQQLLNRQECARILDYQLAVTIFTVDEASDVTKIFGRINSGGRQLSPQERRQAGIIAPFSRCIRSLSSELRGDISDDVINLVDMPIISIDTPTLKLGYGIHADETFWCKQGVLRPKELRESMDEQIMADIVISLITSVPFNASRERLDDAYDPTTALFVDVQRALATYGERRLCDEIKAVFALLSNIIESVNNQSNALREIVNPTAKGNPIRTPFYALFMALHQLSIVERKQPSSNQSIVSAIRGLSRKLETASHHVTADERRKNIDLTRGLINSYFVHKEPPLLGHGISLTIDFENSIRRSKIETPRYEFKQGLLRLDQSRQSDPSMIEKIANTVCAIANIGPDTVGYLFIGVVDKEADAIRIKELDNVSPQGVDDKFVVGIDREAQQAGMTVEQYVRELVNRLDNIALSSELKADVLAKIDTVLYKGLSVVRLTIPSQKQQSWVGEKTYLRKGSETVEATGKAIAQIATRFAR